MTWRRFSLYWALTCPSQLLAALAASLQRLTVPSVMHSGLQIGIPYTQQITLSQLAERVGSALRILRGDRISYQRFRREIRRIYQVKNSAPGKYVRGGKVLYLDITYFDWEEFPDYSTAALASLFVYYSTLGALNRKCFATFGITGQRIHKICAQQSLRFLRRNASGVDDLTGFYSQIFNRRIGNGF